MYLLVSDLDAGIPLPTNRYFSRREARLHLQGGGRGGEVRPIKYTKNFCMKLSFVWPSGQKARYFLLCMSLIVLCAAGCRRSADGPRGTIPADLLSSNVIDKWFTLQIRLYKNATGI